MEQGHVQIQWPREKIEMTYYAHRIMNYRYHWHPDVYELNLLLSGQQEFCRGKETHLLEKDDVLLIPPRVGHASYGQRNNTCAFVIHFSAGAFRRFVKKGSMLHFPSCWSDSRTRDSARFSQLRYYCAQICFAHCLPPTLAKVAARAALDLLIVTLCAFFSPQTVGFADGEDERQRTVESLISYIEEHYNEKISLEDLAKVSGYNRTYLSTLFKNVVGINFHEYLSLVRFQQALLDLALTDKSLTAVALDNGFSELKTLNTLFREIIHRTPAEYRSQLSPDRTLPAEQRSYISLDDPLLVRCMSEYARLPERATV